MGLKLDELELASLRGEVQEVSLSLNFDTRMGRGKVSVAGPRFSGLQGEALSGGVRWERDVIRLEKAVLQQRSSRWEFLHDSLYLTGYHVEHLVLVQTWTYLIAVSEVMSRVKESMPKDVGQDSF